MKVKNLAKKFLCIASAVAMAAALMAEPIQVQAPRAARAVGYAMAACTDPAVPCHRVMARDGTIREHAFGPGVQRALLEAEGVPFTPDGRVDLSRCRWDGR